MPKDVQAQIEELEGRAEKLRSLLRYAPRAFVMEFSGTPKSGKSTSVEAVRQFLSRHGFRVHVLAERAAVCPIPMKGHLFFNTWCASSMLAELLANVESQTDIIIVDRGLFDALVWLTLQEKRGELTGGEARTIGSFLLLDRWRRLIDVPIVMSVSVEEALAREKAMHITAKSGSIMNPTVLSAISCSVDEAISRYGPKFNGVISHDTTNQQVNESNIGLANKILDRLERFLNPDILAVTRREVESLLSGPGDAFGEKAVQNVLGCVESHCRFMARDEVEKNFGYVQIIPSAILKFEDQIFLFERKETDPKYRLFGKTTIWKGCHVSRREGLRIPQMLKEALLERITRLLFLSRTFPVEVLGYCWDAEDEISSRHLGIIYQITIDNSHTALDLKRKEFKSMRGDGFGGRFVDCETLWTQEIQNSLESWSLAIREWLVKR